jgi:hypothetical protein
MVRKFLPLAQAGKGLFVRQASIRMRKKPDKLYLSA